MKTFYDSIEQIMNDVDNDSKVYWMHKGYVVIKDNIGQYHVHCTMNDNYVGLKACPNPKAYFKESV